MRLCEAAGYFKIPKKVLVHLKKRGLLNDPLSDIEVSNLSFMRYVWRDRIVMRASLQKMSQKKRAQFCEQAPLSKPEAYALNRYLNSTKKIYLNQVVQEICYYYKLPKPLALDIAKRMRWKWYRYKRKKCPNIPK